MSKNGILLHSYHLGAEDWDNLVVGSPERDEFGTVAAMADVMLDIPPEDEVLPIICEGPSQTASGVHEGTYTKQLVSKMLGETGIGAFAAFERIRDKADETPGGRDMLRARLAALTVGPPILNTVAEIHKTAPLFERQGVRTVYEIASANHLSRTVRDQTAARHLGIIGKNQRWYATSSETAFAGSEPGEVTVLEPPHRGDDWQRRHPVHLTNVMARFLLLPQDIKKVSLYAMDQLVADAETTAGRASGNR
jgi:hypothetical protein